MTKPIIEKQIDNRSLKSYGLKLGDWYATDFGDGQIAGLKIIKANVNSFEFNKGEIRHMVQVELESGEIVGQEIDAVTLSEKMFQQVSIDRMGIRKAREWKMFSEDELNSYTPSI